MAGIFTLLLHVYLERVLLALDRTKRK
nr:hypothetical protein [Streptococcus salivarius]